MSGPAAGSLELSTAVRPARAPVHPDLRRSPHRRFDGRPDRRRCDPHRVGNQIEAVEAGPGPGSVSRPTREHLAFPGADAALPGLIDAHVHVTFAGDVDPLGTMAKERDEELVTRGVVACERMVRAGVTTAFDCGARNSTGFAIRDAIARRQSVGPRFMASGRPVTDPTPRPLPLAERRGRRRADGIRSNGSSAAPRRRGRRRHQDDGDRRRRA